MSTNQDHEKVSVFFERLNQAYPAGEKPDPESKGGCINFLNTLEMTEEHNRQYCLQALDRRIQLRSSARLTETPEKKALYQLAKNMHEFGERSVASGELSEAEGRELAQKALLALIASRH